MTERRSLWERAFQVQPEGKESDLRLVSKAYSIL